MPELETKSKLINGREVSTTQFPVAIQSRLLPRLGKMIAPALTRVDGIVTSADVKSLGPAIAELFSHLDEKDAWDLQLAVLANTTIDTEGQKLKLASEAAVNLAFGADLLLLWDVVMFALEVNFGPLFDRVRSAALVLFVEPPQSSPSKLTSTG